ncbi:autotransporter assembly complex family protein [Candidatus Fukatsuia symbiotica]|nr:autotransporter assembly complex family protein [Candidatus Fukatsuia symbiotica]MEA9444219.1 autotransporter assembly complex family protein [Candidatus Fukatsuia symbiotica]
MPRYPILCFLCVMLTTPFVHATIGLQINGLSGELEKNVQASLSTITADEISFDGRFQARVQAAIRQGLRALGYYDPTINFDLQQEPKRSTLVVNVVAGTPVRLAGVDIRLRGMAKDDPAYQALVSKDTPKIESILNHGEFDDFTRSLSALALRKGYFDADMIKKQLGVAQQRHQAFWDIDFDSGQRYRFGHLLFQGAQIREDYLQNLVPFHEGDYYSSDDLAELNRRLAATNWFNSAVVSPNFTDANTSKILPLEAIVTPKTKNTVELGGGYATDIGPRVKASWRKPWLNSRGHSLTTSANISVPGQSLDFSYRIPLLKNPLEHYYLLQSGFKRINQNDTKSDISTLNVARFWNLSSGWQRAVNLRWSLEHYTQGQITHTPMLLYPGVSINRIRQRGGAMPTWGDSQRYSLDVSNRSWGSDLNFGVIQAQHVWIRTLGEKNRFVLRGNLGWIETNNFDLMPSSLRFFAGGDRSIRGYKYNGISPRDSKGKLTGAAKLATTSVEYQYNVTDRWWGAVFVDAGEAVNDIHRSDFKTGAGVGVRWASPIGPVRFDIALPIGDKETQRMQFYISLGPEL